ncbi:MAG TPA: hypothetical protein VFH45_13670 [Acidimicrobiales bacterium]|nr:hypothetical protein [Acidimicrobiales bacterium]
MDTQKRAERYIDLLLERIAMCKYPSKELMDRVERAVILFWEEEREDVYADAG